MSATDTAHLVSSRSLIRSTLWSLAGQIAPGLVAIVVVPILIHGFGTDRFGVLSLSWMIVGYFSLFDLGTGRALTKLVADVLGAGQREKLGELIWTALVMMAALGAIAMIVAAILSRWLVFHVLKIPSGIQEESLGAFYLLSVSLPFVITSTGLRGVLEGLHRFDLVNGVRIPQGMLSFIAPLFVLPFTKSLVWMVGAVIAIRVLNWMAFLIMCLKQVPELRHRFTFRRAEGGPLLRMGGWLTVANVLSSLNLNLDRFVIGSIVSVAAVAYYSTPFDLLIRLTLIPGALSIVLFPTFAFTLSQDKNLATHRLRQGNKFTFVILFPILYLLILFAPELMTIWVGPEFARNSAPIARILGFGVLLAAMALIPVVMLQAAGRSDYTAKIQVIELPLYIGSLWALSSWLGLRGAAIAFVGRNALDSLLSLYGCELTGNKGILLESLYAILFAVAVMTPSLFVSSVVTRALIYVAVIGVFGVFVVRKGFTEAERELLVGRFRALARS